MCPGDTSNFADLDRLYKTVQEKKGIIDALFASAGFGEFAKIGEITEEHFYMTFALNVRGTLSTVQKARPLFTDGGSDDSSFVNGVELFVDGGTAQI